MGLIKIWLSPRRHAQLNQLAKNMGVGVDQALLVVHDQYFTVNPIEVVETPIDPVPARVRKAFEDCCPGTGRLEEAEFWSIKRVARVLKISNYNRQMVHWMHGMGYHQKAVKRKGRTVKGYWVVEKRRVTDGDRLMVD